MKLKKKTLLHAMIDKDISKRKLCKQIGLSEMTLYKILSGHNTTFSTAKKIAKVLEVDVFDLIDKENS